MKQQKWPARLASAALVAATLGGVALAAGQQGSQGDPLITLSYLNEKATPALLAQVDTKVSQREAALTTQLTQVVNGYYKQVEDKLAASGGGGTQAASFVVVTLAKGQQLTATAGCELLLRSGSATCVTTSVPGLVDMTAGATLGQGGALVQNHLYLATVAGRGVKATAAVTLMVRGGYTVA